MARGKITPPAGRRMKDLDGGADILQSHFKALKTEGFRGAGRPRFTPCGSRRSRRPRVRFGVYLVADGSKTVAVGRLEARDDKRDTVCALCLVCA